MKKITDLRNGVKYELVPKQKRTISINFRLINQKENSFTQEIKRFLIDFPQSIFIEVPTRGINRYYTYAVDEKNNLCYHPFLNVSRNGIVCMEYESRLDAFVKAFYTSKFSICYDTYSDSLNKYFYKSEYHSLFGCERARINSCNTDNDINLAQQNIENFYNNFNVKLIPVEKADLMFAGDFIS